jgi:hypothetical protein
MAINEFRSIATSQSIPASLILTMRTLALIAFASALTAQPPSAIFFRTGPGGMSIVPSLHSDPPNSPLIYRFVPTLRSETAPNGSVFYTRIFVDQAHHAYLGYELLLERRLGAAYLATVGKLGVTPMDLAARLSNRLPIDLEWTSLAIPSVPDPRQLHDGDTISIELFVDPATGDRLIDDIRINPPVPTTRFLRPPQAAQPVPTVAGAARDFSAADAEFQILRPRAVILNGTVQGEPILRNVRGPLVWIYIPDHGRYILSLTPRPGLDFAKAGEVRGGAISFTVGGDSIRLESNVPMAAGDAPYNLWVLHDQDWEPVSADQKDRPGIGSVGAAELTALKK